MDAADSVGTPRPLDFARGKRAVRRSILTVAVSALLAAPAAAQATWADMAPLFRTPPQFEGQFGPYRSPLVFADGSRVRTATDWPRRRAEILEEWRGLMGTWPPLLDKVPLEVLSETHRETFTQRRVRLEVAPGQRVEGWLLVPDGLPSRAPAVLVPFYEPDTSVGLGPRPQRDFARLLTRAGFVTLSIGTPVGDARTPDRGRGHRAAAVPTTPTSRQTRGRRWPPSRTSIPCASAWLATLRRQVADVRRRALGSLRRRRHGRPRHRLRRDPPQRELLGAVVPRVRPAGAAAGGGATDGGQPAHGPVQGDARARHGPARTAGADRSATLLS